MSDKQLTYTLNKVALLLEKDAGKLLQEKLDLTFSQFRVLIAVNKNAQCSQKKIADFWEVTEAGVSRHIENLLKKGFIESKPNQENRREHLLKLTVKGKNHLKKAFTVVDDKYEKVYGKLEKDERNILTHALNKLLDELGENQEQFDCYSKNKS